MKNWVAEGIASDVNDFNAQKQMGVFFVAVVLLVFANPLISQNLNEVYFCYADFFRKPCHSAVLGRYNNRSCI